MAWRHPLPCEFHHCDACGDVFSESLMSLMIPHSPNAYWLCKGCEHDLDSDEWRPSCVSIAAPRAAGFEP